MIQLRKYSTMLVSKLKYTFFLFLIIFLAAASLPAAAQEGDQQAEPITISASAGFDGYYKAEFWVPVQINVSNTGPAITGNLEVTIGSSTTGNQIVYTSPIDLPTQSNKRITTYVYIPTLLTSLNVELVDEKGTAVATARTNTLARLDQESLLYGVVSTEANELAFLEDVDGGRSKAAVAFLGIEDLPEAGTAWNALDILVFQDADSGQLTAEQLAALKGWISTGGQLVVSGGPSWQKTSAALTDLLPVTITGSQSFDDLPALSTRTGIPFRDPGPYLVTTSSLRSGELLLHQDGLPILARQTHGRGSVYFLALDPNIAPLLDWDGSELLWAEIASVTPRLPTWAVGAQNGYAAGTAVSSLPELALPSALQLFFFLFIYVIVVGPINYFVLRRMKRRELAWITIPAVVVFFSVVSYITGFRLKGNSPILNEMSIAYGRTDGDQLRVQSLIGLYSPQRKSYDVVFPGDAMARPFNRNFGGGLSGNGTLDAIQRDNDLTLAGVRVDVSDIETFVSDSYQSAPDLTGEAVLQLDGSRFKLEVNVQNNSSIRFENVVLMLGTTTVRLGDLAPGESSNHTQFLTSSEASDAAGTSAGFSSGFSPSGPSSSPLAQNFEVLLGTSNYYDDRDVYPRWQLLQAISPDFYGASPGWYPSGVATIIAWSDTPQIDIAVEGTNLSRSSTTLYFLELPFTQTVAGGENVEIPNFLLDWQVLGENGVFAPAISDLELPRGWIEFEYQPWPEFQAMTVKGLEVALIQQNSATTLNVPKIQLWDWSEEFWVTMEDGGWGRTAVSDPLNYIGPGNTVRIRLQNDNPATLEIKDIYPIISGDF
ncbi:MAG: hypothetical protein WAM60_02660 [Candidatus Promineifilaceae bacterium]